MAWFKSRASRIKSPPKSSLVSAYGPSITVTLPLRYCKVVALSGLPGGENVTFTVTYRRGDGHKPEGSLVDGECVPVKDGMIFNVTRTDKS